MTIETSHILGIKAHPQAFSVPYLTPSGESHSQQEGRNFSSVMGQIVEDVTTKTLTTPIDLEREERAELTQHLGKLINPLRPHILGIKMPEGKTLSHAAVLPYYIEAFSNNRDSVRFLSQKLDSLHSLSLEKNLDSLIGNEKNDEIFVNQSKLKYFMDGLIIISRLTLNGVGENLKVFGNFLPDVTFREQGNGNIPSTQLDGIFMPKKFKIPKSTTPLERENLVRKLAQKDEYFPEDVPPILRVPAVLEVKTHFRPRQTAKDLQNHVPPYLMAEMTNRIASALTEADIAIAPTAIIFLRLRSLGQFSINIIHPTSEFYRIWEQDLLDMLYSSGNAQDITEQTQKDNLSKMIAFLEYYHVELQDRELERMSHPKTLNNESADQPQLKSFKMPKVKTELEKKPRLKKTEEKETKDIQYHL